MNIALPLPWGQVLLSFEGAGLPGRGARSRDGPRGPVTPYRFVGFNGGILGLKQGDPRKARSFRIMGEL